MIVEFLNRLTQVLSGRLQPVFPSVVEVAPGTTGGNDPRVLLANEHVQLKPLQLGDKPEAVVPGDANPRRIVRANWTTRLRIVPTNSGGQVQVRSGLDACLYALDAPDFRNGQALGNGAADPGFLVKSMQVVSVESPLDGVDDNPPVRDLILQSEGYLWPAGQPGASGPQIAEVFLRGVLLPMQLEPARLVAGSAATPLTLNVRPFLQMTDATPGSAFASLALRVLSEAGTPGAGVLQGQTDGLLITDVTGEQLTVNYVPPAEPTTDVLVVSLDDNENGAGQELARFTLKVVGE